MPVFENRRSFLARSISSRWMACFAIVLMAAPLLAQVYGRPDRESPGDEMIQAWLARRADEIHARFLEDIESLEVWKAKQPRYREEYLTMLGLWPLPERTPLETTVTGTERGDRFVVEKLHYQSRPGLRSEERRVGRESSGRRGNIES